MASEAGEGIGLEHYFENNFDEIVEFHQDTFPEDDFDPLVISAEVLGRKAFDEESLNLLAQSISEHGVLQLITVQKADEGFTIVMGERRFRASKLAGLTTIPAMLRDYVDTEVLEVQVIENLQRKDVEPTLEAEKNI